MKYYIIAGERSGDLHGSNLVRSLKKVDPLADIRAWGGDLMSDAGAILVTHYRELGFMGFLEVILNLRKIFRFLELCRRDISAFNPDVIILIDFAGFNFRIAAYAHQKGYRVFYYISPKIWAWYTRRVYKVKANVERMFVILPFEVDFYRKFGVEVDYVGNPVVQTVRNHHPDQDFIASVKRSGFDRRVALLPGSRFQEVKQSLPLMVRIAGAHKNVLFLVAGVNNLPADLYAPANRMENVRVEFEKAYDILSVADAAIVTSGTATLETALWKVPQVVIYKANLRISAWIARMVIKVKFISLVNLIENREVVKELIQENLTEENLAREFNDILDNQPRRREILEAYDSMAGRLGEEISSDTAALRMIKYLESKS
jgi:lipid-A-disaccharide synthase